MKIQLDLGNLTVERMKGAVAMAALEAMYCVGSTDTDEEKIDTAHHNDGCRDLYIRLLGVIDQAAKNFQKEGYQHDPV